MTTIGTIAEAVKRGYTLTFEPHGEGVAMRAAKGDVRHGIACELEGVQMDIWLSKLPNVWKEEASK